MYHHPHYRQAYAYTSQAIPPPQLSLPIPTPIMNWSPIQHHAPVQSYFPPPAPPPLPMDPANPAFSVHAQAQRQRRSRVSTSGPPKAKLGGPNGRPYDWDSAPAPAPARSATATPVWKGRRMLINLPQAPFQTTWDLRLEKLEALRPAAADAEHAAPAEIPLPLSPMERGALWPVRTVADLATEFSPQVVHGLPNEEFETVDPDELQEVWAHGMKRGGKLEVKIPNSTAWIELIQGAADRLAAKEAAQDLQDSLKIFGRAEADVDVDANKEPIHEPKQRDQYHLPPAPRLKAVRSVSDRPRLVHPSPTRPTFMFRQLSGLIRRSGSSGEDSPAPSPLILPDRVSARVQPDNAPEATLAHQLERPPSVAVAVKTQLSISAAPFVPAAGKLPRPPKLKGDVLSRSAAAYLPPWITAAPTLPRADPFIVYPSVRDSREDIVTAILRHEPAQREDPVPERLETAFCSYDTVRWPPVHEDGGDQEDFEYDRSGAIDSRSVSEFSNPSDEDEYIRQRLMRRTRQWSSSSPSRSPSPRTQRCFSKRPLEMDDAAEATDNERDPSRPRLQVKPARRKQSWIANAPAAALGTKTLDPAAKLFEFGKPQSSTFRSLVPPQALMMETNISSKPKGRGDTGESQAPTLTETYVTADGCPLATARALRCEATEQNLKILRPLNEVGHSSQCSLSGSALHLGNVDGQSSAADENPDEGHTTLIDSTADVSFASPQGSQLPASPTCDPATIQTSRAPQSTPVDEWQKDIMHQRRYPVSPERSNAGQDEEHSLQHPVTSEETSAPSTGIGKRDRRPIPSFDPPHSSATLVMSGFPQTRQSSDEFPLRPRASNITIRARSGSGSIAYHPTHPLSAASTAISASSIASVSSRMGAAGHHEVITPQNSCDASQFPSRVERFMERVAEVLEQQSRLLLRVTSPVNDRPDLYPDVKTHSEELLSALVAGQHILLEHIGAMTAAHSPTDNAPTGVDQAISALEEARQALFEQIATSKEQQAAIDAAANLASRDQQLVEARAAHGRARSELQFTQEQLESVLSERDDMKADLSLAADEMTRLREDLHGYKAQAAFADGERHTLEQVKLDVAVARLQVADRDCANAAVREELHFKDVAKESLSATIISLSEQVMQLGSQASSALEASEERQHRMERMLRDSTDAIRDLRGQAWHQVRELQTELDQHRQRMAVQDKVILGCKVEQQNAEADARHAKVGLIAAQTRYEAAEAECKALRQKAEGAAQAAVEARKIVSRARYVSSRRSISNVEAREELTRNHYEVLHRWASECRQALAQSEALRCRPYIIHDVHTGDYAEVVTPNNRLESLHPFVAPRMEPSSTQDSMTSSACPATPPKEVEQTTTGAADVPSSRQLEQADCAQVVEQTEDGWWRTIQT